MKNKKIFVGMAVLALLFGITVAGCGTVSFAPVAYVDTEISQEIYRAANELVASKEGGITVNELMSGLSDKFAGLTTGSIDGGGISFDYQDKNYKISASWGGGDTVSVASRTSIVEKVFSVKQKGE